MGLKRTLLSYCPLIRHFCGELHEGFKRQSEIDKLMRETILGVDFTPWGDEPGGTDMVDWKEAFEQNLAKGGNFSPDGCIFCEFNNTHIKENCDGCVLTGFAMGCTDIFGFGDMDNSERRAICRHVLATVKDFTDRDEIRKRIAEMLDDETRRKFLGAAEEREPLYSIVWIRPDDRVCVRGIDMEYAIHGPHGGVVLTNGAGLASRVATLLNREAE